MAKYKYILTVIITLCTLITYAQPAQYTPMTAAGYQMKRLKVDSTLHLPSFCGVPTLRGSSAKEGALAIDTCGGFLFIWTNENGWDTIGGSGGGSGVDQDLQSVLDKGNSALNKDLIIYGKTDANQVYFSGIDNSNMPFMALQDSIGGGLYQYTYPQATIEFINKFMNQKLKQQDSIRATIYLPAQISDATDTLAMLSDVRAVSGGGDFWKINGITNLTDNVTIKTDKNIQFSGIDNEMLKFYVLGEDIKLTTSTNQIALSGLQSTTDTSTYKPLGIDTNGKLAPLESWVSGGSGGIDSLKRSSDSVYARKNGEFIFQFKDSVGGGSGSDTAKVVIAQVHNATATTLVKGEVVYLFGSTGNVASVKRANNKTDATSSKTFGIVRRDIPAGGTGFITTQGQIEKLNLGSYTEGDVLWLDSIDGQFTKVKPQAPYHGVFLGIVERANNGNGLAYIKVQNGYELGEIHDVKINGILNNQILVYSDTQQVWKNRNIYSIVDTTVFQRKSLSANTIMANNTNATANATAQNFKQFGNQTYSDSITFTGASNPSGAINHSFRWSQIGNLVTLHITLTYATVGSLSQVAIEIPDGLPTPILPTGLTANNDIIAYGSGFMVTNTTAVAGVFSKVFLRQNTGLVNDYEVVINQGANASYRIFNATIQYFAQ